MELEGVRGHEYRRCSRVEGRQYLVARIAQAHVIAHSESRFHVLQPRLAYRITLRERHVGAEKKDALGLVCLAIGATCTSDPYALKVVSNDWLEPVRDLIDSERVFIGTIFIDQRVIEGWSSLHGVRQPALKSARMTVRECKRCGDVSTWPRGKEYFDAPDIGEQVLLVNANGIYLREDVVREREIPAPAGSYEPTFVQWKA